ncbi:MAG: hypothetical protein ISS87_00600 [Candidatus Pacebacteria bacterium]|nr:hypothetical protein [Candidatus Paceibacterota bacterium]
MKKRKKFIIILFSGVFLILNLVYNKEKNVLASEESGTVTVCQNIIVDYMQCSYKITCEQEEIDIGPSGPNNRTCCLESAVDNKLEIPIGRAVDQAELLADKIIEKTNKIIDELDYSQEIDISDYCKAENCNPQCDHYGEQEICTDDCSDLGDEYNVWQEYASDECNPECAETTPKCCKLEERCLPNETEPCIGDACDSTLISVLDSIINQSTSIQDKFDEIVDLEKEIEELEMKLHKSRQRLLDCALISPTGEDALLQEYTGLINCADIKSSGISINSVLGNKLQKGCYGNQYCKSVGTLDSCAEDYFCCR